MSREALKELIKAYKETDRARRFTLDTLKVDPQLTEQQLLTTFRSLLPDDIQKETKKHFSTWSKKDVTIADYQQYLTSGLPKTGVTQPFTCYAGGQVQRQPPPGRSSLTPHAQAQQQWQRDQAEQLKQQQQMQQQFSQQQQQLLALQQQIQAAKQQQLPPQQQPQQQPQLQLQPPAQHPPRSDSRNRHDNRRGGSRHRPYPSPTTGNMDGGQATGTNTTPIGPRNSSQQGQAPRTFQPCRRCSTPGNDQFHSLKNCPNYSGCDFCKQKNHLA